MKGNDNEKLKKLSITASAIASQEKRSLSQMSKQLAADPRA
jgi:hypothetical protein